MDPSTAFVVAALMMLLNGTVIGLIYGDLPPSLRPAADLWRLGTLLIAIGSILLASQRWLPLALALPVANAILLTGTVAYTQALRRFDGLRSLGWLWWIPVAVATMTWLFVHPFPDVRGRVLVGSIGAALAMAFGCRALLTAPGDARSRSRRTLTAIFLFMVGFFFLRAATILIVAPADSDTLDTTIWVNIATPMLAALIPVIGTTCFLLMCSDRLRRDWEIAASTDQLTGLANRRVLQQVAHARIAAARHGSPDFALAIVDIDHFKRINDRLGHEAGDRALRHVAQQLRVQASDDSTVCRQGGEEFVVLYSARDRIQAYAFAEALRQVVAEHPHQLDNGHALPITISIGATCWQDGDQTPDDLLRRADRALYAAKHGGRNRVEMA